MKRKWKKLWLVLALMLALGMTLLRVQRIRENKQELARQAAEVESVVASLEREKLEHQRNLARWYNYNLELGTSDLEAAYGTILNFGEGRMAVLAVPEWELQLPVFHAGAGVVSHDPATPLPIGGRGNHTVLNFSGPYPWAEGMTLYIDCLGTRLIYRVESVQVMDAGWPVERRTEGGLDLLTLVCDRGNTRTLVRCVRCTELVLREGKATIIPWYAVLVAAPSGLVFPAIWWKRRHANRVQRGKNCRFSRKNRVKSKLS